MHFETDFESVEDDTGLGPVELYHTMTLTSGWLRLVWYQWYIL